MEDKIKLLYNTVGRDYNLGTYDEFKEKLQDEEKRKAFYNAVGQEYNLGDYDTFSSKVSAPSAPSAEEVAEEMRPEEANQRWDERLLGKITNAATKFNDRVTGDSAAYLDTHDVYGNEKEQLSQEVLDQRAQMRDDLKASGVIDEMEAMKKDARKAKRKSFFEMMGAMPQVGMTGVAPSVFDNSEEEMESRLESIDRAIEAGHEYTQNKLMQSTLDEALDMARQGEINMDDGTFMGNLARGVWDSASRLSTWDMGYSDIVNGLTLNQLVQKWENDPESLTATEKRVLEAVGMSAAVQEAYAGTTGIGYAVGQSLPHSAAFMVSMGLNPAAGAGEAIAKAAVKKMGKQAIKSLGKKGARVAAGMARLGGEAAEAAVMAGTVGLGRVGADALERINGDSRYYIDDDGYIQYGGQKDQKTVARAAMEAFGTTFVEGYTEGLGRALFDPALDALKGVVRGGVKKSAINQMGEAVLDIKPSTLANAMRDVKKTAKIDSMVGELLEEEVGMMLNWWDNAWTRERAKERGETYIFDLENQLTTLLSTCIMTGAINGAEAAGDYATRRRINKAADNADLAGKAVFGEAWGAMRDKIDTGTPEEVVDALRDAFMDPSMDRIKKRTLINYASSRITAQYYNAEETRARGELAHEKQQLVDAFDAGYNSRLPEYYNMSKAVAEAQAALTEYGETTGRTEDMNAAIEECYAHPEQMRDILAEMSEQEQMLIEDYIYSKARMDGAYQGRSDKAEDYVDEFAYSMEPFVVTDERGNRTITVANLTRGNSSTPVYVMQNDGKNAFIMYEDGRSEMVLAKELQNVNTQNAERVIDMFRQQTGAEMEAETQNAVNYREGVQEPSVGMELRQGDEVLMVTAVNGDEVQVVPAKYNPRTQQMEPTKATPRSISVEEAKQIQNDHIEDEEAKKNFRQGTDVTFYVDGEAVNAHVDRGEDVDGMYTVRLDRDVNGLQRVGKYTLDELREWTTPTQQGELLQLDSEADKASAEEGENATMSTEEMEQSVSDYVPSEYDKVDAEDFLKAIRANTMEAYQDYLDKHQNGSFREAARRGWWTLENDFEYHSKEDNDRYISEHVKKAENWLAENVIEPTGEVADNVTDEAAEVADNVEASLEDVVADLLNQGLEDAEVDDFVAYNTKTAMDKADKLLKKKPTMAQAKGDIAQYKALKAAWEEELLAAQRDVQYWADTAKEVQRQREVRLPQQVAMPTRQMPTPKAKAPKTELSFEGFGDAAMDVAAEILADDAPQNGLELAAAMLSGTGKGTFKLIPESYRRHTGYTTKEQRRFPGLFAKKENGGLTIERMGELVMQADREEGTNFFDQSDPNAGMNAVIEVLSQASTMSDINNYIARAREQRAWEEASAIQRQEDYYEQEAKDTWYMEHYHATEEELDAYNEWLNEIDEETLHSEEEIQEIYSIFADEELEYGNERTDAGLLRAADGREGQEAALNGSNAVGIAEQGDITAEAAVSPDRATTDRVAEGGEDVRAESDVEAEAQEWADITAQRIEELEDEIIDLEDRLVVLEADRDAAQLTGEVELIDDAIADMEARLRDALAERDGLLSLAEESRADEGRDRSERVNSRNGRVIEGVLEESILAYEQKTGWTNGLTEEDIDLVNYLRTLTDEELRNERKEARANLKAGKKAAESVAKLRALQKYEASGERAYVTEQTGIVVGRSVSMEQIEEYFVKNNTDEDLAELFRRILPLIKEINPKITFEEIRDKNGDVTDRVVGDYTLRDNHIRLNAHSLNSAYQSGRGKASTVAHEMLHAITKYALQAYKDGVAMSPKLVGAAKSLNTLYEKVKNNPILADEYGIKSVDEMVSELADPVFRAKLKQIDVNGKSLLERIMNIFKRMVNLVADVFDVSAYDKAMRALDELIDNFDAGIFDQMALTYDGGAVASIKTYREGGRDALVDFVEKQQKKGALTEEDAQDIMDEMDFIYELCTQYTDVYAPFGKWSEAEVVVDDSGKPVFSVIKANNDYVMNLDFSLVCKKRRTLDAVLQEMIDRGIINDYEMGGVDIAKINEIIRDYGFETACRVCFVDAKRFRVVEVAEKFVDRYNKLADMTDEQLERVIKQETKNTVRKRIAQYLLDNPSGRKHLDRGQFVTSKGFEKVKVNDPAILSLYNAAKGSGGPKASYGDVQYLNDVANAEWSPEDAYAVGGVRIQSFSDYVPRMVLDYVQMMADLSAAKLPAHAYTKEELFAKQFGLTGVKVNLSLVPRVDEDGVAAGLDKDGNYAWQEGETFPFDEAIAIQNAEGYRENCGTIAIGVSDEQIEKMLDDENIRMVIPYHKSGLNPLVAKYNKIDGFKDYTKVQNTRNKYGKKLSKEEQADVPDFNALMHQGMDAREAAQAYLDWCDEKGYMPKFDKWRNHPNYYKLLEDFTTIVPADGAEEHYPQREVRMQFPTEESAFGSMNGLIQRGLEEDAVLEGRRAEMVGPIVAEIERVFNNPVGHVDVKMREAFAKKAKKGGLSLAPKAVAKEEDILFRDGDFGGEIEGLNAEEQEIVAKAKADGTYLKAPNGADTNLTPEQWVRVRTKNFIRWFGDWINDPQNASKVVDENGEPMVVYHSSNHEFTRFDPERIGTTNDLGFYGRGFYFTPNEQYSKTYGEVSYPVFLNIREPFMATDMNSSWASLLYNREDDSLESMVDEDVVAQYKEQLEGADGVIHNGPAYFRGGEPIFEIVASKPNQIKSATENNGEYSEDEDIRNREGEGPVSDREVSYENDPIAKWQGKPRYYGKRAAAFAERERARMQKGVEEAAKILGIEVEIITDASTLKGRKAKAKGWYDINSKKVVVVVPNHVSKGDAVRTVLHEGVAHHGLRELFGAGFDAMLDNIYNNVAPELKARIDAIAERTGVSTSVATEEYLASLAEDTNFEYAKRTGWWTKIKGYFMKMLNKLGMPGLNLKEELTDNELRYLLWRSYQNLVDPNSFLKPLGYLDDVAKQKELKVGNYAENTVATPRVAEGGNTPYGRENPYYNKKKSTRAQRDEIVKSIIRKGYNSVGTDVIKVGDYLFLIDHMDNEDFLNLFEGRKIPDGYGYGIRKKYNFAELTKDDIYEIVRNIAESYNYNEESIRDWLQELGLESRDLLELDIASELRGGDRDYGVGIGAGGGRRDKVDSNTSSSDSGKDKGEVVGEESEIRYSLVGGNSGYVGYSMSKRAAQARNEGRFPKTDFKKEYGINDKVLDALVKLGIINNTEWHHTSKFGNKTPFYGWEEVSYADYYEQHREEIAQRVKAGETDGLVDEFEAYEEEQERLRRERLTNDMELTREYGQYREENAPIIPAEYNASNGVRVVTNGSSKHSDWKYYWGENEAFKKYARAAESELSDKLRAEDSRMNFTEWKAKRNSEAIIAEIDRESAALGVPVRIVRSVDELPDEDTRKRAVDGQLKGYFDTRTGEVVIYAPHATSVNDVKRTILHETVGHKGLRKLLGDENFNKMMVQMYRMLPEAERKRVWDAALGEYGNLSVAMEEYLAEKAETLEKPKWWQGLATFFRHTLGIIWGARLTDADINYLLWRGRKRLTADTPMDMATDVLLKRAAKQSALTDEEIKQLKDAEMRLFEESGRADHLRRRTGSASREYERAVSTLGYRSSEAFQDSMLGLKKLQEAIAKDSGKEIADWEDAYMAENRMTSVNLREMEMFKKREYQQLLKAVSDLMEMGKDTNKAYEAVVNYMMAKHGLERNEKFARRDAEKEVGKKIEELNKKLKSKRINESSKKRIQRQINELNASIDGISKALPPIEAQKWYDRRKNLLNTLLSLGKISADAHKESMDRLDVIYNDGVVGYNRKKDYSGLTALTGESSVAKAEAEARRMVEEFEASRPQHLIDTLWDSTKACTHRILEISHEAGVMSDEVYNELMNQFEYYIPLRGFDETTAEEVYFYVGGNDSPYNAPIKSARGRKSKAEDPIANIGNMAESAIVEANRNKMKQSFYYMALNHKTDLVSISEVWMHYDATSDTWVAEFPSIPVDATPDQVRAIMKQHEETMQSLAKQHPDMYAKASEKPHIPYRVEKKANEHEHQVVVKMNGKDVVMTVNGNPRAAQAVNGLTNPEANKTTINNIASWTNRNLSANFTTRNPAFVVGNFVRDGIYTNSVVWAKESPKYAWAYNKNFGKSTAHIAGLVSKFKRYEAGDKSALDMNDPMQKMFYEFMMNGGETGYTVINSVDNYKKMSKKGIKRLLRKGAMKTGQNVVGALAEGLETFGRWAEDTSRFAAYMTSRQMGRSVERSIYDAKEISVNFNKKGAGSKMAEKFKDHPLAWLAAHASQGGRNLYVFWNAGIQGLTNFGRVAKNHPFKFAAMAGVAMGLGAIIPMLFSGDDDDDEYYLLPEYVRRSNICLKAGEKTFITLPLPIEMRALYGIGELAYSFLSGKEKMSSKEATVKLLQQMSQVMPIDMLAEGGGWNALVPSAIKPVWEAYNNVDWTGQPIYRSETPFNENNPTWTLAYKSTSPELVALSKMINEATNEDMPSGKEREYNRGWADNRFWNNPAVWEHIFEGYLGGIGTITNQTKKTISMVWNEDMREVRNVPIVSRFVKSAGDRAKEYSLNDDYYDALDVVDQLSDERAAYKRKANEAYDAHMRNEGDAELKTAYDEAKKLYEEMDEMTDKAIRENNRLKTRVKDWQELQKTDPDAKVWLDGVQIPVKDGIEISKQRAIKNAQTILD